MKHIKRIALALIISTGVLLAVMGTQGDLTASLIVGVVALIGTITVLYIDKIAKDFSPDSWFYAAIGSVLGAGFALLLTYLFAAAGIATASATLPMAAIFVLLFGLVGSRFTGSGLRGGVGSSAKLDTKGMVITDKILDTSVVIDGRILDIVETHFIDGPFIVPNFVLREIQLISDSPDPVKRNRGRRGLEMLNKLQQNASIVVKISYQDYSDTHEVDAKLIKMSRDTGGKLVTNDFNLNKVAELQGVKVLNLNNLTNALKPIVLPGEDITIDVIREGKDENQGIGYMEDGTMVVVENGRSLLSKRVNVTVTSIIQTAAGKMIFTRAKGDGEEIPIDKADDRRDNRRFGGNDNRQGGNRGNQDYKHGRQRAMGR